MPPNPILICARSPELRTELEGALAGAGYSTEAVTTPADAVAAMRGRTPDLIVAEGLAVMGSWVYDLLEPFHQLADPATDLAAQSHLRSRERARRSQRGELDNDF